jgi:hypothetical protein
MTVLAQNLETELRELFRETAQELPQVGEIQESLKWGQPSFAPAKPRIGSSVRLQHNDDGSMSLMFICNSGLVEQFRERYGDGLAFVGNREIVLRELNPENREKLKHCVSLTWTYHLKK